jgi:predicted AlkP superfamily phosphohydrolase/phosphomutase
VIALDGATWDRIDPLIARGRLPHLAKLCQEGARGALTSIDGVSPTLFTTIATGKTPEQHGILRFVKEGNEPFTSADRKVRALWNVVSERGGTANVVGWFTTWPAEEVNGAFISDRCEGPLPGGAFPGELDTLLASTGRALPPGEAARLSERLYGPSIPAGEVSSDVLRDYASFEASIVDYFRTTS